MLIDRPIHLFVNVRPIAKELKGGAYRNSSKNLRWVELGMKKGKRFPWRSTEVSGSRKDWRWSVRKTGIWLNTENPRSRTGKPSQPRKPRLRGYESFVKTLFIVTERKFKMKPLITALAVAALLVMPGIGKADVHTWDGEGLNNNWSNGDNWNQGDTAPTTGDSVVINDSLNRPTCVYDASAAAPNYLALTIGDSMNLQVSRTSGLTFTGAATVSGNCTFSGSYFLQLGATSPSATPTVTFSNTAGVTSSSLTIDSDTPAAARSFNKAGAQSYTVTNTTTVTADMDNDNDATLQMSAGTLDVGDLVLDGGEPDDATHGQALFDYDSGTLVNPDTVVMRGDSKIDAESGITVSGPGANDGTVTVEATTNAYGTDVTIDTANGTMYANRLVLTAGTDLGDTVVFRVNGTFQTE